MDFSFLTEQFVIVVLVACLALGYMIKHASFLKRIPNDDIPVILAIFGAVLNGFVSGFSAETVIYGAVMGLSTTGLNQAFKAFVEGNKKTEDTETTVK